MTPEQHRDKVNKWQKANPEKVKESRRKTQWKIKLETLAHYSLGGSNTFCNCCGEKEIKFLTIDHLENDGATHRKEIKCHTGAGSFYYWLKRNGYPKGFQTLCMNCNLAKSLYKICPHQQ